MMRGTCQRCGWVGLVERDHPTGTVDGCHLHPGFTVSLCRSCHRLRSTIDQATGVEGGSSEDRPWLVARRLSAWFGCLASAGRVVPFGPDLLSWLARVLEERS